MKGTIEIETYPNEAPKTVDHILALIKRNFYNGQRILRIVPGQLVQFGDPQTRDMTKQAWWGRGFDAGSGKSIGVAEFSKKRLHKVGSVSMAHAGDAREADSQMFISLSAQPKWNGQYTVFGQVISGMDVVRKLAVTDRIVRVTLKPESGRAKAGGRRHQRRDLRIRLHERFRILALRSAVRAAPSASPR